MHGVLPARRATQPGQRNVGDDPLQFLVEGESTRRKVRSLDAIGHPLLIDEWQQTHPKSETGRLLLGNSVSCLRFNSERCSFRARGHALLLEVAGALGPSRRLAGRLHGRQEQRDEDADDGDHHQEFDEGKCFAGFHFERSFVGIMVPLLRNLSMVIHAIYE